MMSFWAVIHLFSTWFTVAMIVCVACIAAYIATFFVPNVPFVSDTALPHIRAILLTVGLVAGAASFVKASAYMDGYNYAITQIASKNKGVSNAVRAKEQDVIKCYERGGDWDSTVIPDGLCR